MLIASLVSLDCHQPTATESRDAIPTDAAASAPPRRPDGGLAALLPYPNLGDWTIRRISSYQPGDLDGLLGPELTEFSPFAPSRAVVADYAAPRQAPMTVQVQLFQTPSPLHAFGLLARAIEATGDPPTAEAPGVLSIGQAGLLLPGRLSFACDSLYVRLLLQSASTTEPGGDLDRVTREDLPELASRIVRALPGSCELPQAVTALPAVHRVRRGALYHPRHALELPPLGPGVSGLYGQPGGRFRLAIVRLASPEAAEALYERLLTTASEATPIEALGERAAQASLSDGARLWLVRAGSTLAVARTTASDQVPRWRVVRDVLRRAIDPDLGLPEVDPRPWRRRFLSVEAERARLRSSIDGGEATVHGDGATAAPGRRSQPGGRP